MVSFEHYSCFFPDFFHELKEPLKKRSPFLTSELGSKQPTFILVCTFQLLKYFDERIKNCNRKKIIIIIKERQKKRLKYPCF